MGIHDYLIYYFGMDLKQLGYFVAVAERGSFSRAAVELGIAQPALSRQIRALELTLRQSLLRRHGRGATTTEAGRLLLEHARGILHQAQRCTDELRDMRQSLGGQVALGLPPSLARMLTVPLIRAAKSRLPQAQISIGEGLSSALLAQVQQGRLDAAMVYDTQNWPDVDITPMRNEALVLITKRPSGLAQDPPPPPVNLAAIAQTPLVIPRRPNAIRQAVERRLATAGYALNVALEVDGVAAILDLVLDGAGGALLPPYAVSRSVRPSDFVVQRIANNALDLPVVLATSARRPITPTQTALLALARETAERVLDAD